MRSILLALSLSLALLPGCGYGDVSPLAYDFAKSLYNITNRKLADRLPGVREQITAAHKSGELSDKESKWLVGIIEDAEKEEWKTAMKAARRMMEDQVDK